MVSTVQRPALVASFEVANLPDHSLAQFKSSDAGAQLYNGPCNIGTEDEGVLGLEKGVILELYMSAALVNSVITRRWHCSPSSRSG